MNENVKQISKARFDALTLSRHPMASIMGEEAEWYADYGEIVLGCILKDRTDQDWGYIVLGRDEKGLFRCIDVMMSFENIGAARSELFEKIQDRSRSGVKVFPQGDIRRKKNEILRSRVPQDKLNPYFKSLFLEGHSPAREIIQEIAYAFVDLDGNFIEQFQTAGFNSRLWELYLYAYLHEELFVFERSHAVPDFQCIWIDGTGPVFIEAVTVNPNPAFDIRKAPTSPTEVAALLKDYMPIKYGSALYSKLKKEYWKLDHVQGHPLVLAIHDFHMNDSMIWSSSAIHTYLYGVETKFIYDDKGNLIVIPVGIASHEFKNKTIPSGFFSLEDAENVSAVLFSNSATISKFNRMGKLAGFGSPRVRMIRSGTCYGDDPNAIKPKTFSAEVDPATYSESWGEGLSMYHNPNATRPIDPLLFPGIAHHSLKDGKLCSLLPEFFPYSSVTLILVPKT